MAANDVKVYLKKVETQLDLPHAMKKKLLAGLRQELEEHHSSPNEWDDPNEVAAMIQSSVSPAVVADYRGHRRSRQRILVGTLTVLLILGMVLFVYAEKTQISRTERKITETTYTAEIE